MNKHKIILCDVKTGIEESIEEVKRFDSPIEYKKGMTDAFKAALEMIEDMTIMNGAKCMNSVDKIREIRKYVDGGLDDFKRYYLEDGIPLRDLEGLLYGETSLDGEYIQHLLDNATFNVKKLKENIGNKIEKHKDDIQDCEMKLAQLNNISFIK